MSAGVASLHALGGATVQLSSADATGGATKAEGITTAAPMKASELRAQLRLQQGRNQPAEECTSAPPESCIPERVASLHSLGGATVQQPADRVELERLVRLVAADWPPEEQVEAMAIALADADSALTCYRMLAEQAGLLRPGIYTDAPLADRDPADDRRVCKDCRNLTEKGRCLSAWRGERPMNVPIRNYDPIPDILGRCERYSPGPDDPDRRSGLERWPGVAQHMDKLRDEAKNYGTGSARREGRA